MKYAVEFSPEADEDLTRLLDFLLERELASSTTDVSVVDRALKAITDGVAFLEFSPFSCRKSKDDPLVRELVIPFGASGYVALFKIASGERVIIGAVRHQREDDYH